MKYRKKPVEIEAIKYEKEHIGRALDFCNKFRYNPHDNEYYVDTLEGCMKATEGDYIIKGVNGEFYPCKPDIFDKTYEKFDEEIQNNKTKKFKISFDFEPYDDWSKTDVKEMVEKVIDPIYHLGDASIGEINVEEIEVEKWQNFIGFELDKDYYDISLDRIEAETGVKLNE